MSTAQPTGLVGLGGPVVWQGELWLTVASRRHKNKEHEVVEPPEVQITVTNSIIDEIRTRETKKEKRYYFWATGL